MLGLHPMTSQIKTRIAYLHNSFEHKLNAIVTYPYFQQTMKIISTVIFMLIWFNANSQCATPTNLAVTATTASSATLSWVTGGSSNWQVEYGPLGFNIGSGTRLTTTSNPLTLANIAGATTFDVYVRDSCSNGSVSSWFGPISFTTSCSGVNQAPLFIDFESSNWQLPTANGSFGSLAPCWLANPAGTAFSWSTGPPFTVSILTGPIGDHTTGSGKYLFTDNLQISNSLTAIARSPRIDISALSSPKMSFWYHMYGSNIASLTLEVKDANQPGGWTTLWTKTGQQQTGNTAPWLKDSVSLGAFAGDTVFFRFVGVKTSQFSSASRMAIDDIAIEQGSAPCAPPNNLTITNATPTSLTASWVSGGSTTWEIEYGPTGFVQGQGTVITTSLNPFTITGLTAETSYDVYVREVCTGGTTSTRVGPVAQSTPCVNSCNYTLELSDSFGDGWTTSSQSVLHEVDLTVGSTTTSYTLPNGSFISYNITVCEDDTIILAFDNNGLWSNECGIVLKDGAGNIVYSRSPGTNFSSGVKWSGSNACSIPCPLPVANFGVGINNFQASFNATSSSGSGLFYNWNFGDGSSGLDSITTHTYTAPGFYTVTLVVTDACGQTDTATQTITIGTPCPTPTASFTATISGLQTNFSANTSMGTGLSYNWSFGDGNSDTGSTTSNTYTNSGFYTVTLIVTDVCGQTDTSSQVVVIGNPCPAPLAAFSATVNNQQVTLTATASTGTSLTYNWAFGDGNTDTGSTTTHTYATSGLYTVTLVVTDVCGQTDTATQLINAGVPCPTPVAAFSTAPNKLQVAFNAAASTGVGLVYSWNYGDGNTGNGINPVHIYPADGTYAVKLTITDACGNADSTIQNIQVCDSLWANYTISKTGLTVNFDAASSSAGATQWNWNFGDGNTATGQTTSHTYATTGTFQVSLTVFNACGETATYTNFISTCVEPVANWSYQILSSGGNGMTVQFNGANSAGANSYFWDFGDGNTNATSAIPVHTYTTPGLFYVVSLIVTNDCSDTDTLTASLAQISIPEWDQSGKVRIYPNPSNGLINVEFAKPPKANPSIVISNVIGEVVEVITETTQTNVIIINMANYNAGAYVMRIVSDNEILLQERIILVE